MIRKVIVVTSATFAFNNLYKYISKDDQGMPRLLQQMEASGRQLKLVKSFVVFRHGARTVTTDLEKISDIPNETPAIWDKDVLLQRLPFSHLDVNLETCDGSDPNHSLVENAFKKLGALPGGCYTGQLTTVGQQNAYDLGQWIGKRYIEEQKLLSRNFKAEEVFCRTSNYARTILSLKCVVSGIYGLDNITEPVTFITRCISTEYIYPNWYNCSLLTQWRNYLKMNLAEHFPHQKALAKELRTIMNMTTNDETLHFIALYDFLHCRKAHDKVVPKYLLENEELIRRYSTELQMKIIEGKERVKGLRMGIGKMVNEICTIMENKSDDVKLYLYSAHDTTIIALLMIFGMDKMEWPDFSASLCLEVYEDQLHEKYVKVVYEKESRRFDENGLAIEYLPMKKFLDNMEAYRVTEWKKECGNKN